MKEKTECLNCNSKGNCLDITSLEAYTDQYIKDSWDRLPQKEKNKTYIICTFQMICVFGFIVSLIVTVGISLFNLSEECEFISLIDDMIFGIGISFLFLLAAAISDLFT